MTNPRAALQTGVMQRLTDLGVPPEKHDAKVNEAKRWWAVAGAAVVGAILLAVPPMLYVLHQGSVSIIIAVVLLIPSALCALVVLFAASQADGEATKAFLQTVLTLGRAAKGPTP